MLLSLAGILYFFIFPFIIHLKIVEQSRNYLLEISNSFDNKYTLQTLTYADETGTYMSFFIELYDTGERVFACSEKYRTRDLKSIAWNDELYDITVISGEVGTINYIFADDRWIIGNEKTVNWSISKYSELTSKHYEEISNGYKAAFYTKDEIGVERISNWLAACEPSEGYYQLIYFDPASWDMFLYYAPENGRFSNDSLKFYIDGSILKVYVENDDGVDNYTDYILIRVQVPLRGAWPSSSVLYLNGIEAEMQGSQWYN